MDENIFENGEYTKSKTNEKFSSAKQKISLNRDDFVKVNEIAKNHGGGYDKEAKSYLFDSAKNRDTFIAEASKLVKNFTTATKKQSTQVNFEVSEHIHTQTGAKIPSAKLTGKVSKDVYVAINEIAESHGGSYSKFAKQFLFKIAEERDNFIKDTTKLVLTTVKKPEKSATPEEQWKLKKKLAERRAQKLTDKLNKDLPNKLLEIFKDGLKVHCPHGAVGQGEFFTKTNYYSGLNAIILAAEMQEKNYSCASFVDSKMIYAMREKGLDIDRKINQDFTKKVYS